MARMLAALSHVMEARAMGSEVSSHHMTVACAMAALAAPCRSMVAQARCISRAGGEAAVDAHRSIPPCAAVRDPFFSGRVGRRFGVAPGVVHSGGQALVMRSSGDAP